MLDCNIMIAGSKSSNWETVGAQSFPLLQLNSSRVSEYFESAEGEIDTSEPHLVVEDEENWLYPLHDFDVEDGTEDPVGVVSEEKVKAAFQPPPEDELSDDDEPALAKVSKKRIRFSDEISWIEPESPPPRKQRKRLGQTYKPKEPSSEATTTPPPAPQLPPPAAPEAPPSKTSAQTAPPSATEQPSKPSVPPAPKPSLQTAQRPPPKPPLQTGVPTASKFAAVKGLIEEKEKVKRDLLEERKREEEKRKRAADEERRKKKKELRILQEKEDKRKKEAEKRKRRKERLQKMKEQELQRKTAALVESHLSKRRGKFREIAKKRSRELGSSSQKRIPKNVESRSAESRAGAGAGAARHSLQIVRNPRFRHPHKGSPHFSCRTIWSEIELAPFVRSFFFLIPPMEERRPPDVLRNLTVKVAKVVNQNKITTVVGMESVDAEPRFKNRIPHAKFEIPSAYRDRRSVKDSAIRTDSAGRLVKKSSKARRYDSECNDLQAAADSECMLKNIISLYMFCANSPYGDTETGKSDMIRRTPPHVRKQVRNRYVNYLRFLYALRGKEHRLDKLLGKRPETNKSITAGTTSSVAPITSAAVPSTSAAVPSTSATAPLPLLNLPMIRPPRQSAPPPWPLNPQFLRSGGMGSRLSTLSAQRRGF